MTTKQKNPSNEANKNEMNEQRWQEASQRPEKHRSSAIQSGFLNIAAKMGREQFKTKV